jgi:redox-sensitive bicupin YhaK (pirin superfamily)
MPEGGPLLKPVNEARGRRGRMMVADIEPGRPHVTGREVLFEELDGIAAYRLSAGPGARLPQPDIDHGGAYYVVLEGEVTAGGETYPPRSCIWVDQHEHPPEMIAGREGASVAFMSFARHAD